MEFSLLAPETACARIGERVRALRLAGNLSQAELAGMTGSSLSSVRRLEAAGQGSIELLVRVAQALHAAGGLDALFVQPRQTIGELEAQVRVATRQRARRTRHGGKT